MAEKRSRQEPLLDLQDELSSSEILDGEVLKAQEQLLQLRQAQEQLEKQKNELEELSRRQDEFEHGKAEMVEKLSRSLVVLEQEAYEAQKRNEQLEATRASFLRHLQTIESLNSREWPKEELPTQLSRALSAIDEAKADFSKSRVQINAEADHEIIEPETAESYEGGYATAMPTDFLHWLKIGFAFTLPLFALGLLLLILIWSFYYSATAPVQ